MITPQTVEEKEYYQKLLKLQKDFLEYDIRNLLLSFSDSSSGFIGSFVRNGERDIILLSTITGDIIKANLTRKEMKEIATAPLCDFLCFLCEEDAIVFKDLFKGAVTRWQEEN